ncbi:hypothetical protein B296_00004072 [Ensete ventricosum]|uniref:Uncharacterized protein n=1 Tax=Ensete ventricosum TaxID=4639 RepID=A0A427B7W7_ENSVE|nr:hypothetical protein B296_00004072 [Ensete ventricosum]
MKHSRYGLDLVGKPLKSLGITTRGLGFRRGGWPPRRSKLAVAIDSLFNIAGIVGDCSCYWLRVASVRLSCGLLVLL